MYYFNMKTNVPIISSLRQPFRSFLLLTLFGLITFGFVTKAVVFFLVQRETEVLGGYYRSIGILENVKNPLFGDISAGIDLIESSPYLAYGDQRQVVSGVMPQTYNNKFLTCNCTQFMERFPEEEWPNVHTTDIWFIGDLIEKEEVKTRPENGETVGYYLRFSVDTVLAAYPEYAAEGRSIGFLFVFKGHESSIPLFDEMEVGQRYFIRGWEDIGGGLDQSWILKYQTWLEIKPLDDEQLWYIPLEEEVNIDFSDPKMIPLKHKIDVLNENLHTLGIIATADMSAMPRTQETSRFYYLTEGRWLSRQDDLDGNKVIVIPDEFALRRNLQLGDELQFTFRPLKDTYYGFIRDGVDSLDWRSYPTYQDTFKIVGLYARTTDLAIYAFIPTNSLPPGFTSAAQDQFRWEADYSFVLDSTRHEAEFLQTYTDPLQELGIRLTILENNGPAYWAAVDPIRSSLSADLLVFGLLMVITLILTVYLYEMQRQRDYAILRALGVPAMQANAQMIFPLLLLGELGILLGGLPAWDYALDQAQTTLSTLPTPAGVSPSADLDPLFLAGLCFAIFLVLAALAWLGVLFLSRKPIYELLQSQTTRRAIRQERTNTRTISQPLTSLPSSLDRPLDQDGRTQPEPALGKADLVVRRKYNPASLSWYVLNHGLRSKFKSTLTFAIALGFVLASGWIWQTMERSRMEIDRLYDTTVIEADILQTGSTTSSTGGKDFISRRTIDSVLNSGFVKKSVLEAESTWANIETSEDRFPGIFPVYAYDSPEAFHSGMADPGSLVFAPGWDMNLFAQPRTLDELRKEGIPALFPASLLAQLQVNVGETIRIKDLSNRTYTCTIVGGYSGLIGSTLGSNFIPRGESYILFPLSALESIEGTRTKFTTAHFVLDPMKNRELPQFRAGMETIMNVYSGKFRFMIWDEELTIVIAQLDRNLSLLRMLYPVVILVSVMIGAGLCFLLLLQTNKEAAILRVLGTTRTAVRLALISEPICLSVIGVVIGLGISRLLWMTSDLLPVDELMTGAGLYLAGALAGSVTGAILITNKQPIELLQVKE
jgi:hypothetical protein